MYTVWKTNGPVTHRSKIERKNKLIKFQHESHPISLNNQYKFWYKKFEFKSFFLVGTFHEERKKKTAHMRQQPQIKWMKSKPKIILPVDLVALNMILFSSLFCGLCLTVLLWFLIKYCPFFSFRPMKKKSPKTSWKDGIA